MAACGGKCGPCATADWGGATQAFRVGCGSVISGKLGLGVMAGPESLPRDVSGVMLSKRLVRFALGHGVP